MAQERDEKRRSEWGKARQESGRRNEAEERRDAQRRREEVFRRAQYEEPERWDGLS
jgi:hypothetical protein